MKNSNECQDGGDEWELVSEDGTEEITDSNIHDSTADRDDASAMARTLNQGDNNGMVEDDLTMVIKDDVPIKDNSSEIDGENGVDAKEKTKSDSDACLDTADTDEKQAAGINSSEEEAYDMIMKENENEDEFIENPDVNQVDAKITSTLEIENSEPQSEDEENEDDLLESPDAKAPQSDDDRASSHSTIEHTGEVRDEDNYETELSENLNTIGQSFRRIGKTVEEETILVAKSVKNLFLTESKLIGRDIQMKAHKISHAVQEACVKHDIQGKAKKAEDVAKAAAKKIDDALKSVGEKAKSFNDEHNVLDTLAVASLIGGGFFLTRGHAPTGAMLLATGGAIYVAGESMKSPGFLSENQKQKI
mmetsp:Transcript_32862/g.49580  ORF Transcript_32862/g.49580 Transcript_32862/m.49580 type:complete len:362 (-) Transcript_32862:296-1381(-)|eukprot:CAMPEP_0178914888 /NCGR_PEP_ID=MMETSP0786-20121207/11695_1 /TAXON_ID=186022 /ORGANISM="Thalassionema frauenfeldii, Strain CCMP 1798" /LENGTH=361 /DNA_ID=CAMNT_0020587885 /DNA_START=107 /DNA_END=1192 /DNA_ORIENTATION=-